MLHNLKVRLALCLLSGLTISERDELLSVPKQQPVVINVNGHPVWFVDTQRIDISKFPFNLGDVIEVKTAGRSVGECFAVVGMQGDAHAESH